MPVGNKPKSNYYSISKTGKIRHKGKDGNEYFYDFIEGRLVKIDLVEDVYEGEVINKYHFYLEGDEETDVLQAGESSSAARGIIMSLACIEGPIGVVRIAPYLKEHEGKTYTNVWFEHQGHTVDWKKEYVSRVPDVEELPTKGGKVYRDDTLRREYYRRMAQYIKGKLNPSADELYQGVPDTKPDPAPAPAAHRSPEDPSAYKNLYPDPAPVVVNKQVDARANINHIDDDDLPF